MGLDIVTFDGEFNILQTDDQSEMNFLNVLELFRIKRIDYSFLGLGVISQSLPISPWHANPQRFEFRTAACCLYWIGGGCHQIPSCHSDELGMTEQKLVFARVDRLTPIPTAAAAAAKQSNSSGICLVYYLSLNFWDWNKLWFHAEVSRPLWCVYVRTYVSGTHAAFVNLTSFVLQPIKSGGSCWEGLFSCLGNWSGYFDSPEERNSTWQEKSNKATAFLVVVHTVVVDDGVYRNIKRKERRPQLRHSASFGNRFHGQGQDRIQDETFFLFGFFYS